jgi:hypothetical protein
MNIFSDMPSPAGIRKIESNYPIEPVLSVNAHFHTPYSFSAFNDIGEIFALAQKDGVDVLGINDFITTAGYEEFGALALIHKRFPLFNIEFMGLIPEAQQDGIRINDPDNPGRIYFCGKGLVLHDRISDANRTKLDQVFGESLRQIREMTDKLNLHLSAVNAPFQIDYDFLQEYYTKGLVRERHLVKCLRIELNKHFPEEADLKKFLVALYAGKPQQAPVSDISALDNELRSRLLKKGGPAFVEENPGAFLRLETIIDIILDAGGIPCYPVLLDNDKGSFTEFEKDYDKLSSYLKDHNIFSVELIPGRNDMKIVRDFVKYFNEQDFLVTFGTEHNTPARPPLSITCRNTTPLTAELNKINYSSACVIAAHQFLVARGEPGYLEKNGAPRLEKKEEFVRFGNAVIRHFIHH